MKRWTQQLITCMIYTCFVPSLAWQIVPPGVYPVPLRLGARPTTTPTQSRRRSTFQRSTSDDSVGEYINRARVWSVTWAPDASEHHPPISQKSDIKLPSIRFIPLADDGSTDVSESSLDRQRHAADVTWNWCAHFVARHNLCPWAEASVIGADAIRIYTVSGIETESHFETVIEAVAIKFAEDLEQGGVDAKSATGIDPNTAICFVVVLPPSAPTQSASSSIESPTENDDWYTDFYSFYTWFVDFEERWPLVDQVTLAPFHPKWKYDDGDDEGDDGDNDDDDDEVVSNAVVELEKQSPFVTVSIVSTAVIDKAGPAASQRIAENNEAILMGKSRQEWKSIYNTSVHQSTTE